MNNVTITMLDEQMIKINFVDLKKLWNFVVGNILILNHLVVQKRRLNLKILKFEFLKKNLGWKNFLNKNCRSPKVMKHCSWQLFDLKTSCHAKLRLNFKIWTFQTTSDEKTTKINSVDLEKLWNIVVDNFLIWKILSCKTVFEFQIFKIQIL